MALPGATLLSRSPELFFALDGAGGIEARPMKGTARAGGGPGAATPGWRRRWRAGREEPRGEPDDRRPSCATTSSRIAEIGSVEVPELFAVESYATVHQMVSRVTGRLLAGRAARREVFAALFPCGSVTGAPKLRAMEIIRELEPWPREAYCGAIGWAAPDGRASFNVAIRTLALYPDGEAVLNVGGGVVADSTAAAEYEEALWKARFAELRSRRPEADRDLPLGAGGGLRAAAGASRAAGAAAAAALGIAVDRAAVERALAAVAGGGGAAGAADAGARRARWRWRRRRSGAAKAVWTVRVAGARLDSGDPWLGGEVDAGGRLHDAARAALPPGVDEAVLLNERGEVCEGTITSVFADLGDGLVTPPLGCGAAAGGAAGGAAGAGRVPGGGAAARRSWRRGRLFVGNSLRGLIPARLVEA